MDPNRVRKVVLMTPIEDEDVKPPVLKGIEENTQNRTDAQTKTHPRGAGVGLNNSITAMVTSSEPIYSSLLFKKRKLNDTDHAYSNYQADLIKNLMNRPKPIIKARESTKRDLLAGMGEQMPKESAEEYHKYLQYLDRLNKKNTHDETDEVSTDEGVKLQRNINPAGQVEAQGKFIQKPQPEVKTQTPKEQKGATTSKTPEEYLKYLQYLKGRKEASTPKPKIRVPIAVRAAEPQNQQEQAFATRAQLETNRRVDEALSKGYDELAVNIRKRHPQGFGGEFNKTLILTLLGKTKPLEEEVASQKLQIAILREQVKQLTQHILQGNQTLPGASTSAGTGSQTKTVRRNPPVAVECETQNPKAQIRITGTLTPNAFHMMASKNFGNEGKFCDSFKICVDALNYNPEDMWICNEGEGDFRKVHILMVHRVFQRLMPNRSDGTDFESQMRRFSKVFLQLLLHEKDTREYTVLTLLDGLTCTSETPCKVVLRQQTQAQLVNRDVQCNDETSVADEYASTPSEAKEPRAAFKPIPAHIVTKFSDLVHNSLIVECARGEKYRAPKGIFLRQIIRAMSMSCKELRRRAKAGRQAFDEETYMDCLRSLSTDHGIETTENQRAGEQTEERSGQNKNLFGNDPPRDVKIEDSD